MLKRRLCEARFDWTLRCEGPLLVADGRYEKDKAAKGDDQQKKQPQKVFISHAGIDQVRQKVRQAGSAESLTLPYYVPGTSLRGPFRAQAERIVRSLEPAEASPPRTACDPFEEREGELLRSCSQRLQAPTGAATPYAAACPACKLFGCTATASRIRFTDAEISGARSVYRDMIGIDRFTGGVFTGDRSEEGGGGGANMRVHALEGATFTTTVTVTNFELWQLGLMAYVLRDFAEELVAIGFGKSKGFGVVKGASVESLQVRISYPPGRAGRGELHLWGLCTEEERRAYGLVPAAEELAWDLRPVQEDGLSLYEQFTVGNPAALWSAAARACSALLGAGSRQPREAA